MVNMVVTNNDIDSILIANPVYQNEIVFTAGAATTYPKGMVVAFNTATSKYK